MLAWHKVLLLLLLWMQKLPQTFQNLKLNCMLYCECCVIRHAGLAQSALVIIIMNAKAATNIPKLEAKLHALLSTGRITSQWIILICTEKAKLGIIQKFHSDIPFIPSSVSKTTNFSMKDLVFCSLLLLNNQNHITHCYFSTFPTILSSFFYKVPPAWPKPEISSFRTHFAFDWSIYRSIHRQINPSIHLYMKHCHWCSKHNIYKY